MRRMKSLRLCAKFSLNGAAYSMRRMKSLRVCAKFSPSARYGFKNWKTLCPKLARGDSIVSDRGQHSVPHRTRWRTLSDASSFQGCTIPNECATSTSPSRVWDVSCTWRCLPRYCQADLSRGGAQNAVALQPVIAKRLCGAVSTVTLKTMSLLDGRMVTAPAALITPVPLLLGHAVASRSLPRRPGASNDC